MLNALSQLTCKLPGSLSCCHLSSQDRHAGTADAHGHIQVLFCFGFFFLKKKVFQNLHLCVCMCVCMCRYVQGPEEGAGSQAVVSHQCGPWKGSGHSQPLSHLFRLTQAAFSCGFWDQSQVVRLPWRGFYPPSHLTAPSPSFSSLFGFPAFDPAHRGFSLCSAIFLLCWSFRLLHISPGGLST